MKNQTYPTDLSDRQWDCIKDLHPRRQIRWSSAQPGYTSGDQRDALRRCEWNPMADAAPRRSEKVTGRKQHILVDRMGLPMIVVAA